MRWGGSLEGSVCPKAGRKEAGRQGWTTKVSRGERRADTRAGWTDLASETEMKWVCLSAD